MRQRRRRDRRIARRQLLDGAGRQTGEIFGRPPKRGERRPAGLIGQGDRHRGTCRERFEKRPFRAGQILEAVREDRLAAPRVEIGAQSLDRVGAKDAAIPAAEPVELRAVRGIDGAELTVNRIRLEQPDLELVEGLLK